jgi:hypothetical protein
MRRLGSRFSGAHASFFVTGKNSPDALLQEQMIWQFCNEESSLMCSLACEDLAQKVTEAFHVRTHLCDKKEFSERFTANPDVTTLQRRIYPVTCHEWCRVWRIGSRFSGAHAPFLRDNKELQEHFTARPDDMTILQRRIQSVTCHEWCRVLRIGSRKTWSYGRFSGAHASFFVTIRVLGTLCCLCCKTR